MNLQITCKYWVRVFESHSQVRDSMPGNPVQKPLTTAKPVKRIAVSELLSGGREAVLLHDGDEYRLRLTSNGKLILTK
jgi:hemin uptake protein HemP